MIVPHSQVANENVLLRSETKTLRRAEIIDTAMQYDVTLLPQMGQSSCQQLEQKRLARRAGPQDCCEATLKHESELQQGEGGLRIQGLVSEGRL